MSLEARHIQNFSEAASLEPHWGYADRAVPCTNDAGSCAYLDEVYHSHDLGMLYSGITWSIIGALMIIAVVLKTSRPSSTSLNGPTTRSFNTWIRKHTLTEFRCTRWLFGRTTRLQVIILAALSAYLLIFTMVGYSYKKWVTPVKKMPGVYNTRTSLGPLADRVGIFAYALTPLSILLCMRESLLSVLTGVPYHHFNFLHRWLGHIIFIQSIVHTIGWCVIEIRLYQPQPTVAIEWIKQEYMIWGVVAMTLLTILWVLSTPWARRRFGYEFFKKAHYVLAMVYIGACWAHWANLKCFLIPSLLLWFVDRGMRFVRTGLIHYKYLPNGQGMFDSIPAKVTYFEGNAVRLDFANPTTTEWTIGQHFFLTFSQFSIWQSHPFTPLSTPGGTQSYILRARSGETKKLADMSSDSTPVILTGPYGNDILQDVYEDTNILCIAGGTGISYVLPVILHLARAGYSGGDELIELVWVVRHEYDTKWIEAELEEIRKSPFITVTIHVTRQNVALEAETPSAMTETSKTLNYDETSASATSGEKNLEDLQSRTPHRPDLSDKVEDFVRTVKAGSTKVYVSGPPSMISDVRASVAGVNDPKKVWRGDERGDVELIYDERLE